MFVLPQVWTRAFQQLLLRIHVILVLAIILILSIRSSTSTRSSTLSSSGFLSSRVYEGWKLITCVSKRLQPKLASHHVRFL